VRGDIERRHVVSVRVKEVTLMAGHGSDIQHSSVATVLVDELERRLVPGCVRVEIIEFPVVVATGSESIGECLETLVHVPLWSTCGYKLVEIRQIAGRR
jgi:hypothetical protein